MSRFIDDSHILSASEIENHLDADLQAECEEETGIEDGNSEHVEELQKRRLTSIFITTQLKGVSILLTKWLGLTLQREVPEPMSVFIHLLTYVQSMAIFSSLKMCLPPTRNNPPGRCICRN